MLLVGEKSQLLACFCFQGKTICPSNALHYFQCCTPLRLQYSSSKSWSPKPGEKEILQEMMIKQLRRRAQQLRQKKKKKKTIEIMKNEVHSLKFKK